MNRSTIIIIIREQKVRIDDWKQVHPKLFVLFPISLVRVPLFYEFFFRRIALLNQNFQFFFSLSCSWSKFWTDRREFWDEFLYLVETLHKFYMCTSERKTIFRWFLSFPVPRVIWKGSDWIFFPNEREKRRRGYSKKQKDM